jgi:two-component system, OmpR family, sensor kinase
MSARRSGPRRRLPIRVRLTIAFAGVLAATLGAAGVVIYTQFKTDLDRTIDADLGPRLADVVALCADARDPRTALAEAGERLAQVYGANGRLIASTRSLSRGRLLSAAEVRRATRGHLRVDRRGTPAGDVRARATAARTRADPRLVVAVGEPLGRTDRALHRLRTLLFVVGPFALLLASYAGYQVARAALRPVDRMRARAERITEHDTAERLPVPSSHDEIEALGRTFNELLARLDAALARERRLLADASHELRTPLTVLRTGIQVALRRERDASELREALEAAGREAERVSRLAEDLLVLARADRGRLPIRTEPLDAGALLDAAAERARGGRGRRADRAGRRGHRCCRARRSRSRRPGARQPGRQRPGARAGRDPADGAGGRRTRRAARDGRGRGLRRRRPRTGVRALQPGRSRSLRQGQRPRAGDRGRHRARPRRRRGRPQRPGRRRRCVDLPARRLTARSGADH